MNRSIGVLPGYYRAGADKLSGTDDYRGRIDDTYNGIGYVWFLTDQIKTGHSKIKLAIEVGNGAVLGASFGHTLGDRFPLKFSK